MDFLAVTDYGIGNLASVLKAFQEVGAEVRLVRTPEEASGACGIILPGVGNFGDGMRALERGAWIPFLYSAAEKKIPLFGICLGMQMFLERSEEAPGVKGLGLIKGECRRFPEGTEKVPHVGWNTVVPANGSPLFRGIPPETSVYFVHSYYAASVPAENTAAKTDYILPFASAISSETVFAVQFHPEKSQRAGLRILKNFVDICTARKEKI